MSKSTVVPGRTRAARGIPATWKTAATWKIEATWKIAATCWLASCAARGGTGGAVATGAPARPGTSAAASAEAAAGVTPAPAATSAPLAAPSFADYYGAALPPPGDVCDVHPDNLSRDAAAILSRDAAARPAPDAAPVARKPGAAWAKGHVPDYWKETATRFSLGAAERAALARDGFVVAADLTFPTFATALHEIYQSELPLYVSMDAILHAVYASHDGLIADLEQAALEPQLKEVVEALHVALPAAAAAAPWPAGTAEDLDLYLTVARRLLTGADVPPALGGAETAAAADALVGEAMRAAGMKQVELFGRPRMIDFTAYAPRGHYVPDPDTGRDLAAFFRGAMWLSRLELNLVSRSSRSSHPDPVTPDPRETPREALDALALADLARRAGVLDGVARLDEAWTALAGRREDVSLADLEALRAAAGLADLRAPDAFDRLRAAIGDGFRRTARLHFMPEGSTELPVIATLLGPRVTADSVALRPLAHSETFGRYDVAAADVAYVLGHDRALAHDKEDLARFPALAANLRTARALLAAWPDGGDDLYGAWLAAVRALAERPAGALPSFADTTAFRDLRIGSALTAWGQLRHNYVLIVGEPYAEGGCAIPDAYVEPAPGVLDALVEYAARGEHAFARFGTDAAGGVSYFRALAGTLRVLRAIVAEELSGRPLSAESRRWLSMAIEIDPGGTSRAPHYTGWYFDLFPGTRDALRDADFIASYHTSTSWISYVGASAPRLGFFVVDRGGAPRVMVGPVARAYATRMPPARRLDDRAARALAVRADPWARSYAVGGAPEPAMVVRYDGPLYEPATSSDALAAASGLGVTVEARKPVGAVTLTLLDHHRRPLGPPVTRVAGAGETHFRFPLPPADTWPEAMAVRAGRWRGWLYRNHIEGELGALYLGGRVPEWMESAPAETGR
jgi:hypothetical protein